MKWCSHIKKPFEVLYLDSCPQLGFPLCKWQKNSHQKLNFKKFIHHREKEDNRFEYTWKGESVIIHHEM
jgi:hypothetical protein